MIKNFVAFVSQLHLFPSYLCLFPSCKLCHLTFSFQAKQQQRTTATTSRQATATNNQDKTLAAFSEHSPSSTPISHQK
jgi:hypothetical protein